MTTRFDAPDGAPRSADRGRPTSVDPTGAQTGHPGHADAENSATENSAAENSATENSAAEQRVIPAATVARLATYLRVLTELAERHSRTVSSGELAAAAGVNSAKLRKDLSHLGSYGVRGVGYDVSTLTARLAATLGLSGHEHSVVLVGVGNLGQALAGYDGFASRGFRIAALLDLDPDRVGTSVRGLAVRHVDDLSEIVRSQGISIGVIATPASAAQEVSERLAEAGVTAILNFAPIEISVPDAVDVRNVDLAAELQILSFHEQRKQAADPAERVAR